MSSVPNDVNLHTARLMLVPFTLELVQAALTDRALFAQRLGAHVPDEWPGPDFADLFPTLAQQFAHKPDDARWIRLIVHAADHTLIGDVGCHGPPDERGTVEIGYSIVTRYRNHGYATEAAQGLIDWLRKENVSRIIAECERDNVGSIRVLEKLGMQRALPDGDMLGWNLVKH